MKRLITIVGLALATMALHGGAPEPAKCAFCYDGECWNSSICFRGCVCLKRGLDTSGSCFSQGAIPRGYSELR